MTSCVTTLIRPETKGTILDFNGNPISNCRVGETITDKSGSFTLSQIVNRGIRIQLMNCPVFFERPEPVNKEGYEEKWIYPFSVNKDTIYLKKQNANFNFQKIVEDTWMVSSTKKSDTIYMIKYNVKNIYAPKTRGFSDFIFKYKQCESSDFNPFGLKNLPEGVFRKSIKIDFNSNGIFQTEKTIQYADKYGHKTTKVNDTILSRGKWYSIDDQTIYLQSQFSELNGIYKISDFDYEYIELRKTIANNGYK